MPKTKTIKPTDGRLKKNRAKSASKAAATKTMKRTKAPTRKRKQ